MTIRAFLRVTAIAGAAAIATPSLAADFNFSFDGDTSGGGLGGTVSGTLFGLASTGTSRPTSVSVQYNGVTYTDTSFGVFGDGFTVSNGMITGANFQTTLDQRGNLNLGQAGFNQLITSSNQPVLNVRGFSGAQYSAVTAPAVPEPATWAMMLVGLGMVGGAARYRRRGMQISVA